MKQVPLSRGLFAIVDDEDYEAVSAKRWYANPQKNRNRRFPYAERQERGKHIQMHREILQPPSSFHVDHINGNGLDNRRSNLRLVSNAQNQQNRIKHKAGTSAYKGVSLAPRGNRWYAKIMVDGKDVFLGSFLREVDAAKAYNVAASARFGEHARLNTIPEAEQSPSPEKGNKL